MNRVLIIIMVFGILIPSSVLAESDSVKKASYISKMPSDGVMNIVVMGDSLADGLHQGLTRLNKDREEIKTVKKSKVNTGLVRVDRYNWNRGAKKIVASKKYQVAIVLLGLNDLQTIREKGKAHHFKTDGWKTRYIERVEKMMGVLKAGGLAVYWVGIPIITKKHYQEEYFYLNGVYREAAKKTGIRFVDTWNKLADKNGDYTPFFMGEDGKKKEIRRRDGVHFTSDGYLIFAGILNNILLSDLEAVLPKLTEDPLATP